MLSGFLNLNKPSGESSNKALFSVKKMLRLRGIDTKVGHLGTLDPLACGVLPVALGRATRLFDLSLAKTKTYIADFTFGFTSETLDTCSVLIPVNGEIISTEDITRVLPCFIGKQNQIPPNYSAKNIQGERAYRKARKGEDFVLPSKEIEVFDFRLLSQKNENTYSFEITCSSGTYIRSLARDVGKVLNSAGVMSSLCRIRSGKFSIENSISTEQLLSEDFDLEKSLLPIDYIIDNLPSVTLSEKDTFRISNGIYLPLDIEVPCKIYTNMGELLGIGDKNDEGLYVKTRLL